MMRQKTILGAVVLVLTLAGATPASACFFGDFSVSTLPSVPAVGEEFELIVDYEVSQIGCLIEEDLVVTPEELRLEIACECIFVTPGPEPYQFRTTVPGLSAGLYDFVAVDLFSPPQVLTDATTQILIGQAPSIPISPLALTLLSLILASVAISILRR